MDYTKVLCYDIKYAGTTVGPTEVEVQVILPTNWKFEFVPARNAVKAVLEDKTRLAVLRFDWRPL